MIRAIYYLIKLLIRLSVFILLCCGFLGCLPFRGTTLSHLKVLLPSQRSIRVNSKFIRQTPYHFIFVEWAAAARKCHNFPRYVSPWNHLHFLLVFGSSQIEIVICLWQHNLIFKIVEHFLNVIYLNLSLVGTHHSNGLQHLVSPWS